MPYNENGQDIFPLGASDFAKAVNKLSVPGVRVLVDAAAQRLAISGS